MQSSTFQSNLVQSIQEACVPYGGMANNMFASTPLLPTVVIPGIILLRAHCVISALKEHMEMTDKTSLFLWDASDFVIKLKHQVRTILGRYIRQHSASLSTSAYSFLPAQIQKEEQGYLSLHVILTIPFSFDSLPSFVTSNIRNHGIEKKRRRRFRGNDPTKKQGGDPRSNLEHRIRNKMGKEGFGLSMSEAQNVLPEDDGMEGKDTQRKLSHWIMDLHRCSGQSLKGGKDNIGNQEKTEEEDTSQKHHVITADEPISGDADGTNEENQLLKQLPVQSSSSSSTLSKTNWDGTRRQNQVKKSKIEETINHSLYGTHNNSSGIIVPSIHVAVWRNAFYLKSNYTKSRRDVSQSPFYVPSSIDSFNGQDANNNKDDDEDKDDSTKPMTTTTSENTRKQKRRRKTKTTMVRRGITSVEEEICNALVSVGCGGISDWNNEKEGLPSASPLAKTNEKEEGDDGGGDRSHDDDDRKEGGRGSGGGPGAVVYGMAKFHASGREDVDVRMILPPEGTCHDEQSCIGGRPFVCEVIDAHRLPTLEDLQKVVHAVNHTTPDDVDMIFEVDTTEGLGNTLVVEGMPSLEKTTNNGSRQYGRNPMGVGIASPFCYTSSKSFKTLQSETENKIKYYGCLCWTDRLIPTQDYLEEKLGLKAWCSEGNSKHESQSSANCRLEDAKKEAGDGSETKKPASDVLFLRSTRYPLEIAQATPLRVLHRRSSAVRTRHVLSLSAERINDHWFFLHLSTSAGTYVKEFVHGDLGRTIPSVASMLGGKADIIQLDCEGIGGV